MKNREEITKEINQRKKLWDEKSNSEKLSHIDCHLVKAREELENARNEIGWLTLKGITHYTYFIDFSKIVVDLRERILIDLEDDLLEMIDLNKEIEKKKKKEGGALGHIPVSDEAKQLKEGGE